MAFIGTPLDTRNTFQSLVGKRFNGDGSTTAFTLDVAPSSTLDLEVFVGNVRQDPNSAYTLSGTTLTFTGAPPSGTNNIYVVHQAKSVGTIDVPTGGVQPGSLASNVISGQTLVTLDNANDHVLINDATDGALKKALIPAASFAGIDDQSSSNDDQLTITDTAVVINEDSDDVDFRVESNGNANMLFVSGGNDVVGIGNEGDLGVGLHIKTSDTGGSVDAGADQLVLEANSDMGMTMLAATSGECFINFGDSGSNTIGQIRYHHSTNHMQFNVNSAEAFRITSDRDLNFGSGQLQLLYDNSAATTTASWNRGSGQGGNTSTALQFQHGGSTKGSIGYTDGSTSYNTSSDYRLKENVTYTFDATTRLKQLKPARFNFKVHKDESGNVTQTMDGFLAHEISSVVPEAVTGEKDAVDSNGEMIVQQLDQAKLIPLLVKTIQELEARVTTLEG